MDDGSVYGSPRHHCAAANKYPNVFFEHATGTFSMPARQRIQETPAAQTFPLFVCSCLFV
jgi:hypothetical protein